jgi:hypothetical protein
MRVRGRAYWLAGVLLYGLAWMSGSSTSYLPVYALSGTGAHMYSWPTDVSADGQGTPTTGKVVDARTRQRLATLGYLPATSAPPSSAGSSTRPVSSRETVAMSPASSGVPFDEEVGPAVMILMTVVQALLVVASLGCMWIGLTRISRHGRFGAEASAVRCPKCRSTIQPPPGSHGQCPHCGLKIRVKRIVSTRRIGIPCGSMRQQSLGKA